MATYPIPGHPWCNGRTYNNAPPDARIWCTKRPPPYWWILELSGFEGNFVTVNGDRLFTLAETFTGYNPSVWWFTDQTIFPVGACRLQWERGPNPFFGRRMVATIQNTVLGTSGGVFRHSRLTHVEDWSEYDDFNLPLVAVIGTEPIGDNAAVRLHLGTYAKIPAKSCYGDYNGPWP